MDSARRNKLPRSWTTAISLALVLCLPAKGTAQLDPAAAENLLHELAFLEGSWAGEIEGTIGSATGQRQYRFIIRDRYLLMMTIVIRRSSLRRTTPMKSGAYSASTRSAI